MNFKEIKPILIRLFNDYIKKYLNRIFFCLFLSLVVAGTTSATAWLLDPAVKKIFIDQDKTLAWLIPILIIVVFSAKGISLYLARINITKVGFSISGEMQKQVANNILVSDIQTLENKHSGKYISNIMYDAGLVQHLVSTGVLNLMKDSLTLIALTGVMFYQNWKLSIFALLIMPMAAFFAKSLGKRVGKITTQASEVSGKMATFMSEIIRGSKIIRIYQKEELENSNANKVINDMVEKNVKIASVIIRTTPIMECLTGFMIAGFIYFSGKLIVTGELGINNFFSFLAAMMLAYQPIRSLATIHIMAHQGGSAAKRIFSVLDEPIKIENDKNLPDIKINSSDILYKNVSFNYGLKKEQALKNINLDIKGGAMTAFVGHSGAGKSTIINLLPRFYDPQFGDIYIDNQKIKEINLKSLRKNISLVSQDVILFDASIYDNLIYANPNVSKQEVEQACKYAAADEFIDKMPDTYNTLIGENGVRLSGGQKQRLSIARAIIKDAPIILLDEATSSLDAESEEIVQNAIKNLTKNKTTLVIAHRLSTIHNADNIYVLKNGNVIDSGNHTSLIKSSEEYKSLYQKQLK